MAKIRYALVLTADQNPQLQLDALDGAGCLKVYTDYASGTKADRPQCPACLADLRAGDTLIIWRIDRLGRNLRGLVDTTTAHGALVFGMFAVMAEHEAALIREHTHAGLAAARTRGRRGDAPPR